MTEYEQLKLVISRAVEHSDHTIYGSDAQRLKRIIAEVEKANGRVTVDDALQVVKNRKQLDALMAIYTGDYPFWLEQLARGVIAGRIKLSGGQCKTSSGLDLLGLYEELQQRFNFQKGDIYQALAEVLNVPGYDTASDNLAYSRGAEKIRQDIDKFRKQGQF
jgi:hypothetical protein